MDCRMVRGWVRVLLQVSRHEKMVFRNGQECQSGPLPERRVLNLFHVPLTRVVRDGSHIPLICKSIFKTTTTRNLG